jgi:hypothetical protein
VQARGGSPRHCGLAWSGSGTAFNSMGVNCASQISFMWSVRWRRDFVFLTAWRCLCIQGRFCSVWLPSGRRNVGGLGSLFEMQNHVIALLQGVQ